MSSSDSSSDPEISPGRTKGKGKENGVKKSKTSNPPLVDARHGKNEGTHPRWKYEPPADAVLVDHDVDAGGFDWDAVNDNDDVELWLMRVPEGVRWFTSAISCLSARRSFSSWTEGEVKVLGKCQNRATIVFEKSASGHHGTKIRDV